jgi:hypothetical protein
MVRYNDFDRQNDPTNTTVAPSISRTATFGHDPDSSAGRAPVWSAAAHDLLAAGEVVSPFARVSLQDGDLEVAGGEETDSDQIVFAPLAVQKRTDYLLVLSLNRTEEGLALKIRTADPRIVIADTLAPISGPKRSRKSRPIGEPADAPILWRVPLATGQLDEVRPILTRDSTTGIRPVVRISGAELFELGPTPGQWTNPIREAMVGIQKNVYKTRIMRLLLALGLILLVAGMRKRVLVLLLSVPAYFILFQSAFHTEYRYILPPHHILFILIATGLVGWTVAIAHAGRWIFARFSANSRAS